MNQIEENVVHSFRLAKNDIIKIQSAVNALSRKQEELMEMIAELKSNDAQMKEKVKNLSGRVTTNKKAVAENQKKIQANKKAVSKKPKVITRTKTVVKKVPVTKTIVKKVTVRPKKHFVASKEGNKLHDVHCPFGKNIKPKIASLMLLYSYTNMPKLRFVADKNCGPYMVPTFLFRPRTSR